MDSTICLEMGNEVETLAGSPSPQHCQEACRDNRECTFFTWQTEICFLFRKCDDVRRTLVSVTPASPDPSARP